MSFKFNFNFSQDKSKESEIESFSPEFPTTQPSPSSTFVPCEEFKVPEEFFFKSLETFESEPVEGFPSLLKRKYSNVLSELKTLNSNLLKITEASDLEPNKYEGGLKTWECSIDLLNFLSEEYEVKLRNILEIGCGSGLPGIFCCKKLLESSKDSEDEQFSVVFQDFNQSVLERVTLPNLILNARQEQEPSSTLLERVKFFYGDWKDFPSKLPEKSFDLILTSETIYRQESYQTLMEIFSHSLSLKNPEARVLLAAKDYYFGLGGSVQEFCKFVGSLGGWKVEVLRHFSEGVPRTILELKRV